jgi:parallel beta-helix repeat protein
MRGRMTCDVTDPNAATTIQECEGTISNNTLVQLDVAYNGLYVNFAKGLTVTGNVARGNAGNGIIIASSNGVTVTGNSSKANTGFGIALTGTTAGQGGHTVQANNVSGNVGGDWYVECPVVSTFDNIGPSTLLAQDTQPTNTTLEKTQFTYVIPGSVVQAGTTYRITLFYVVDNIATSGILTLRSYGWGGGLNLTSVVLPSQVGAATGQQIFVEHLITVRNISSSVGKIMPVGNIRSEFSNVSKAFGGTVVTTNTVVGASLLFTAQWGTANAGNICRLEAAAVDVVKS